MLQALLSHFHCILITYTYVYYFSKVSHQNQDFEKSSDTFDVLFFKLYLCNISPPLNELSSFQPLHQVGDGFCEQQ